MADVCWHLYKYKNNIYRVHKVREFTGSFMVRILVWMSRVGVKQLAASHRVGGSQAVYESAASHFVRRLRR